MEQDEEKIDIDSPPDNTMFAAQGQAIDMFPGDDVAFIQNCTSYWMYIMEQIMHDQQMHFELQTDSAEHIYNKQHQVKEEEES